MTQLMATSAELAAQAIGHRAMQKQDELEQLADFLADRDIRSVCEIGTYAGGTLWLLAQLASDGARIVSVDLEDSQFQDEAQPDQDCEFFSADSHDLDTGAFVCQCFPDGLDVLFIDGDHSYEGVKQDWEMYRPLVSEGGLVIFHDICEHAPGQQCEVSRLWAEIKAGHETIELISEPTNWGGLGVVRL